MSPEMLRVKLRPDVHLAPVETGLYCSRGAQKFVLAGPPALYQAVDGQLGALTDGTDLDALVTASGDGSRPFWRNVLATLVQRDVLLDLDAVAPAPNDAQAARYADVLAWLESVCADPYAAFARLRTAVVAVRGAGPAEATLVRSLTEYGVGTVVTGGADGVDGVDGVDLTVALDGGEGQVIVRTAADYALVGAVPAVNLAALATRVEGWLAGDPTAAAPRPMSAVIAGSLAAHTTLRVLAGLDADAGAVHVVHGHDLQVTRVEVSTAPAAVAGPRGTAEPEEKPETSHVAGQVSTLTARWRGPVRLGRDTDLPQLPLALVTAAAVERPVEQLGFGINRGTAGLAAALAALRTTVDPGPGGVAAAGLTETRWLADGALRLRGTDVLAQPGSELTWDELRVAPVRAVWSLLEKYFGTPTRLVVRQVPDLGWCVVSVEHAETGALLAAEWGQVPSVAAQLALLGATAYTQAGVVGPPVVGTHVLDAAPGAHVTALLAAVQVRGERVAADAVLGEPSLTWGPVYRA